MRGNGQSGHVPPVAPAYDDSAKPKSDAKAAPHMVLDPPIHRFTAPFQSKNVEPETVFCVWIHRIQSNCSFRRSLQLSLAAAQGAALAQDTRAILLDLPGAPVLHGLCVTWRLGYSSPRVRKTPQDVRASPSRRGSSGREHSRAHTTL